MGIEGDQVKGDSQIRALGWEEPKSTPEWQAAYLEEIERDEEETRSREMKTKTKAIWLALLWIFLFPIGDHAMARFLSPDPKPADEQNFNRYWYANNNPYTFVDPDGREGIAIWRMGRAIDDMNAGRISVNEFRAQRDAAGAGALIGLGIVGAGYGGGALLANPAAVHNTAVVVGDIAAGDALGGASIGVAAMALKLSGAGHEMFQSARNLIANSAASAADKVKAFDGLSARISSETGGAWSATKMPGADGSTIYSGGRNMMVIDSKGNVYSGALNKETLPASNIPDYDKLRRH